tara:strand:- start:8 stop:172 length:165 start_codon:yes stop_codon:yes gene_type:complete
MHSDKSELGFIRAMARELLVHRADIKDVGTAIALATELLHHTPPHTVTGNDRRS